MVKRTVDVITAIIGLVILSPLLVMIGIAIRITSPGPVLYRAIRVGQYGNLFQLYKFRSMYVGADRIGPGITHGNDNRITPIGKFLRESKLDELPQLFNVLIGDISLVGPRPEDPHYVTLYTEEQRQVLTVRPGITSLASIMYRAESELLQGDNWEEIYIQSIMPNKLTLDLEYVINHNLWLDISILLATMRVVVCPHFCDT